MNEWNTENSQQLGLLNYKCSVYFMLYCIYDYQPHKTHMYVHLGFSEKNYSTVIHSDETKENQIR